MCCRLIVLALCAVCLSTTPAHSGIGFGGEGGWTLGYRDHAVRDAALARPDYLKSLGAHMRVSAGSWEIAAIGIFNWRTINIKGNVDTTDLAIDVVSASASLRRLLHIGPIASFVGAGPVVARARYTLSPLGSRTEPEDAIKFGALVEAGFFHRTPWRRAQIGAGVRQTFIASPYLSGTLVWVGFTILSPER